VLNLFVRAEVPFVCLGWRIAERIEYGKKDIDQLFGVICVEAPRIASSKWRTILA
jgi:hypothetical protein